MVASADHGKCDLFICLWLINWCLKIWVCASHLSGSARRVKAKQQPCYLLCTKASGKQKKREKVGLCCPCSHGIFYRNSSGKQQIREWYNAARHAFRRAASERTQVERERALSLFLSLTLSLQRRITCFLSSPFRRSMLITLRRVPSTSNAEAEEPRSRSSWRWGGGESDKHPQHCCDPPERLT